MTMFKSLNGFLFSCLVILIVNKIALNCAQNVQNETVPTEDTLLTQWRAMGQFGFEFFNQFSSGTNSSNISESELTASVSSKCAVQLRQFQKAFVSKKIWPVKFIDAWGKFPSGLLYGHFMSMGNFEECLSINEALEDSSQHVKGKYCLTKIPFGQLLKNEQYKDMVNLKIGICIPAACDANEIDAVLREFLNSKSNGSISAATQILKESSCSVARREPFEALDWVAISILSLLAICMILSTCYDYWATSHEKPLNPLLSSFSIRSNMRQLFRITTNTNAPHVIPCLHGIRCLSIIWIIFGHCYMMLLLSPNVINATDIINWAQTPFSMFLQSGTISVDSFFFLSGLLLIMVAMREMEKTNGKLNVPLMYLHRYLRLTPVLALAVLIFMTLYRYVGDGPLWNSFISSYKLCDTTWWATLIYVQNYAAAGKMCLGHSWYLAVDTQLYVISPLVLIVIWKWKRKGLAGLMVFGLLLAACLFSIIVINQLTVFDTTGNLGGDSVEMRKIYYSTHTRVSPWLIGIIFGYFLHGKTGRRVTLKKPSILFGWIFSLAVLMTVIFSLYPKTQPGAIPLTPLAGAFYLTLSRIGWPLALCWIVFACVNGYAGPVNQFLSWTAWQPISKLSYCMYIWHLLVESVNAGQVKTDAHFSNYDVILRFWGDFGITMLVSITMYLAIEAPMVGIEKFLFSKKKKATSQPVERVATTVSKQNLCD